MVKTIRAGLGGSLAALALAGGLMAATPAAADGWHGHGGYWWGPAVAFGALGLATGAMIAASQQPYYYGYYYPPAYPADYPPPPPDSSCWGVRPVYDSQGHYLGRHPVDLCR